MAYLFLKMRDSNYTIVLIPSQHLIDLHNEETRATSRKKHARELPHAFINLIHLQP